MGATAGRGHGPLLQRHNENGPHKRAHLLFGSGGLDLPCSDSTSLHSTQIAFMGKSSEKSAEIAEVALPTTTTYNVVPLSFPPLGSIQ